MGDLPEKIGGQVLSLRILLHSLPAYMVSEDIFDVILNLSPVFFPSGFFQDFYYFVLSAV